MVIYKQDVINLVDVEYVIVNAPEDSDIYKEFKFNVNINKVNIPKIINIDHGNDVLIPFKSSEILQRCDVYDINFIRIFETIQYNVCYIKYLVYHLVILLQ